MSIMRSKPLSIALLSAMLAVPAALAHEQTAADSLPPTALTPGQSVAGSTVDGAKYFTLEVPKEALLFTVTVRSQKRGNHLDLYVNAPSKAGFPLDGNNTWRSTNGYDGGSSESIHVFNQAFIADGQYRITVAKNGKEGCDFTITANYQVPRKLEADTPVDTRTDDDGADGSKFFYFTLDQDYDLLDLTVTSKTYSNGLDLYLNTPDKTFYPHSKTHVYESTNGYDGGSQEWIAIDPPKKVPAGTYRISLTAVNKGTPDAVISYHVEKHQTLVNNQRVKKTTRRHGEYLLFNVPEGAKKVTIQTDSIVKENILDLYVNTPFDEAFPTRKAHRYVSDAGYEKGAQEKIVIEDVEPDTYYIWIDNLKTGKDYAIRASYE